MLNVVSRYFVVVFSGGIILLLFKVAGSPFHRGFFCDDESLMHPFHDSTVTSLMLYGIGFLLSIVFVSDPFSVCNLSNFNPFYSRYW